MLRHRIPAQVPPMPLERYLRRAWPLLPGGALRQTLKRRDVKRGGVRLAAGDTVRGGDELTLYLPDSALPQPAELVFDDGRLAAAVKPQGLPVDVDADGVGADTLLTRLRQKHPAAALCHRLDAGTGGVVLAALDPETLAQAEETFRTRALRKTYLALARGGFRRGSGEENAWLVKDAARASVRVTRGPVPGAKEIATRYRVVDDDGQIARVELEPVTGRTHQLRAHMASLGHPLLGDDRYGDRTLNARLRGPLRLWCASLTIGREAPLEAWRGMTFEAAPPEWWTQRRRTT